MPSDWAYCSCKVSQILISNVDSLADSKTHMSVSRLCYQVEEWLLNLRLPPLSQTSHQTSCRLHFSAPNHVHTYIINYLSSHILHLSYIPSPCLRPKWQFTPNSILDVTRLCWNIPERPSNTQSQPDHSLLPHSRLQNQLNCRPSHRVIYTPSITTIHHGRRLLQAIRHCQDG